MDNITTCPTSPSFLLKTRILLNLNVHLKYDILINKLSTCLKCFVNYNFKYLNAEWINIIENVNCLGIKIKLYVTDPQIPQYVLELHKLNGDITEFYNFLRELNSLLNNISSNKLYNDNEINQLSPIKLNIQYQNDILIDNITTINDIIDDMINGNIINNDNDIITNNNIIDIVNNNDVTSNNINNNDYITQENHSYDKNNLELQKKKDYNIMTSDLSYLDIKPACQEILDISRYPILLIPKFDVISVQTLLYTYQSVNIINLINTTIDSKFIDMLNSVIILQNENINQRDTDLNVLLHYACKFGHDNVVSILITANANINIRDQDCNTPLYIACNYSNQNIVKLLIDAGANVDAKNSELRTALSIASEIGLIDIVNILLNAGANVNTVDEYLKTAIHYAAEFGHNNLILKLSSVNIIHTNFIKIRSPLHWIALTGQLEICKILIENGDDINALDTNNDSPLILACIANKFEIIELLIAHDASIDIVNNNGKTCLHYIDNRYKNKISEKLIKKLFENIINNNISEIILLSNLGIDINCTDQINNTPLFYACQLNLDKVVELLMSIGANPSLQNIHGINPIMETSCSGNIEILRMLIFNNCKSAYDLSIKDNFGRTALYIASALGHVEILKLFMIPSIHLNKIINEFIIDVPNIVGCTPLSIAVANGHNQAVNFILACGANTTLIDIFSRNINTFIPPADINPTYFEYPNPNITETNSIKIIHEVVLVPDAKTIITKYLNHNAVQKIYHAAKYGLCEVINKIIIENGHELNLNAKIEDCTIIYNDKGKITSLQNTLQTAFFIAACNGHNDVINLLLMARASSSILSKNGSSPIYAACKNNFIETVRLLINAKVDVTIANKNNITCINIAAYNKNLEIVKLLINAKKNNLNNEFLSDKELTEKFINTVDITGLSPLHQSIAYINYDIVKLLLLNGANCNAVTMHNYTPIFMAAFHGHTKIIEQLLLKNVDINIPNNDGATPIAVASYKGYYDCVELLIKAKANIEIINNVNKVSPLFLACKGGHYLIMELLIKNGGNINIQIINGNSLCHCVCIDNRIDMLKLLIKSGANYNMIATDKSTPLYLACENKYVEIANYLLDYTDVNVNIANKYNVTPLSIASENELYEIVNKLIKKGADLDIQCERGLSALLIASQNGYTLIAEALINAGANPNIVSKCGKTAIFLAVNFGHVKIVRMLIDAKADINKLDNELKTPIWWAVNKGEIKIVKMLINAKAKLNIYEQQIINMPNINNNKIESVLGIVNKQIENTKILIKEINIKINNQEESKFQQIENQKKLSDMVAQKNNYENIFKLLEIELYQELLCCICCENSKTVVNMPCKHLVICFNCDLILSQSVNYSHKCIMCMQHIDNKIHISNN